MGEEETAPLNPQPELELRRRRHSSGRFQILRDSAHGERLELTSTIVVNELCSAR